MKWSRCTFRGRYCPRPCNNQLLSHDCPCSSFHVLSQSVREEREINKKFTISIAWSLSLWFLPVWQIEESNNPHKLEKLQENFEYATAPAELLREFSTILIDRAQRYIVVDGCRHFLRWAVLLLNRDKLRNLTDILWSVLFCPPCTM